MRVQTFNYRFPGMRKPDNFIVYPKQDGETTLTVQGDRTIARFDPVTRQGVLNWRGSNAKYGHHLSPALGAEEIEFPQEFVRLALNYLPSVGDTLGGGVVRIG